MVEYQYDSLVNSKFQEEKPMTPLLVEAISQTKDELITNSELKGGTEIHEVKLNYSIAQAIMSLGKISAFGKGEVDLPYIFDQGKGYVYQREDFLVLIEYERNKGINRMVLGQQLATEEEYVYFVQSIILLEMCEDTTNTQLGDEIVKILSFDTIKEGTEEASLLSKITMTFETMFKNGTLNPYDVDKDEYMEIIRIENIKDVLGIVDRVSVEPEVLTLNEISEVFPEVKKETDDQQQVTEVEHLTLISEELPLTISEVAAGIKSATESGIKLQHIAELSGVSISTLSEIQNLKRTSVREKTLQKISDALKIAKVEESAVKPEAKRQIVESIQVKTSQKEEIAVPTSTKPSFDMETIRRERPIIFDDEAVRHYLKKFEFETYKPFATQEEFIDAIIAFRTDQREKHVPQHALMKIESKLRYVGEPAPLEAAIKNMLVDVHILLKGPAGAGKTVIAQTLSALLNMPLYTMNGSGDSDSDIIIGSKEAANGSTYAVDGRLVEAMKNAGLFYADETNFVLADILAVINAALDHRKHIYNDNTGEDVFGHSHFRFIGAINEGYEGTRKMNEATIDRTVTIMVDYMSPKHLEEYLRNYDPGYTDFQKNVLKMNVVSDADIIMLKNIATRLQTAVKQTEDPLPQEVASIRNIEQILKMTRTMSFESAVKQIIQKYDPDIRSDIAGALQGVDRLTLKPKDFINY